MKKFLFSKIDVQGAENLVIADMIKTLEAPGGLVATMERSAAFIEQLWDWGFTIYEIGENHNSLLLVDKNWPALASCTPRTYLNLLCYKI